MAAPRMPPAPILTNPKVCGDPGGLARRAAGITFPARLQVKWVGGIMKTIHFGWIRESFNDRT